MSDTHLYKMSLDLNVLNHLGINLYSNVSAVLAEVVANAWDADAENVCIDLDGSEHKIVIQDDGHGMTRDEINAKYLTVGYERRKSPEDRRTPKLGRPVMGRKGIGKLSLFSIADDIEVWSAKDGAANGFVMSRLDIEETIRLKLGDYHPVAVDASRVVLDRGTRITLTNLRRRMRQTEAGLRRRLARRFSVISPEYRFAVLVNGRPIEIEDRDYFNKLESIWWYGSSSGKYVDISPNVRKDEMRPSHLEGTDHEVSGWIGTVERPSSLRDEGDNLNKVVLIVRGKLAQEDILEEFGEAGVYTKYVIGEIHADFLDQDDEPDIATSSRQRIIEDEPRYLLLKAFILSELRHIKNTWSAFRHEVGVAKALEIPAINQWFTSLSADLQRRARALFGKINELTIESEEDRRELFRHGVLAFESLRYKENLDALERVKPEDLLALTEVFVGLDDIEAIWYHQIVRERLQVIRTLQEKVDANALEKVIQKHLFSHLWLLDPSWERATSTPVMEARVAKAFAEIDAGLTDEERQGRLDIKYKKTSGEHVIVELKRAERKVTTWDLIGQIEKYRTAVLKILKAMSKENEAVAYVCVLGSEPVDWANPRGPETSLGYLRVANARIVRYDELIDNAYRSYEKYLEMDHERGKIAQLIEDINTGNWTAG